MILFYISLNRLKSNLMEDSWILISASALSVMILHAMWAEENFNVYLCDIESGKHKYCFSIMKIILTP